MTDTPATVEVRDLVEGMAVVYCGVPVTVVAAPRPWQEPSGGDGFVEVLARREDTGREGFMRFGPGDGPLEVNATRPTSSTDADSDLSVPPFGGWTFMPQDVFDPCAGGHVPHTYTDDGTTRCNRCGRAIDPTPCGCGTDGHEQLSRSYCQAAMHRDQRAVALRAS